MLFPNVLKYLEAIDTGPRSRPIPSPKSPKLILGTIWLRFSPLSLIYKHELLAIPSYLEIFVKVGIFGGCKRDRAKNLEHALYLTLLLRSSAPYICNLQDDLTILFS